jgi:DNA-binding transcriptional LysR family regulator
MHRNLDIALFRAFEAVASTDNMTIAADRLGLTQGAVSQQIKRLEETLQCAVFDRSQRKLKLTKEGKQLLSLSRRLLDVNDEIWNEMRAPALRGKVRLGIPDDLVTTYLPETLNRFVLAYPNVEVSLISDTSLNLKDDFLKGKIDVALVEETLGPPSDKTGECVRIENLLWIGAKQGTAYTKRRLPLSIVSETCAFRTPVVEALEANGITWQNVFENGTIDATLTTVRADLAVSVSLASVIPADLEILGPETGLPNLPSFAINLYKNEKAVNPAAFELATALRESVREYRRLSA